MCAHKPFLGPKEEVVLDTTDTYFLVIPKRIEKTVNALVAKFGRGILDTLAMRAVQVGRVQQLHKSKPRQLALIQLVDLKGLDTAEK